MNWLGILYPALIWLCVIVYTFIIFIIIRRRDVQGSVPFIGIITCLLVYSIFYGMELIVIGLPAKVLMGKFEYFGLAIIHFFFLLFSLKFTQRVKEIKKWVVVLLLLEPIFILFVVFLNDQHGLFWTDTRIVNWYGMDFFVRDYGPLFWLHIGYFYLNILIGTILLVIFSVKQAKVFRMQSILIIIAVIFPWVGSLIYLFGFSATPYIDTFSFSFLLTGIFFLFAIYRYNLFMITPIAKEKIFNNIKDPIIVTDLKNRLNHLNKTGYELFKTKGSAKIGEDITDCLGDVGRKLSSLRDKGNGFYELELTMNGENLLFEVFFNSLESKSGSKIGYVYHMRDITERKNAERILLDSKEALEDQVEKDMVLIRRTNIELKKEAESRKLTLNALKQSEKRYRDLVDNANEGIIVAQDGRIKFLNPMIESLFGYSKEKLINRSFLDFIHPEDKTFVEENYSRRLEGEDIHNIYSFRIIHSDGSIRWIQINVVLIEWDGKTATMNLLSDVTLKRIGDEEVLDQKNRAEFYLDLLRHDIGNIHQGIYSSTQLIRYYEEDRAKQEHILHTLEGLTDRAMNLVRNVKLMTESEGRSHDVEPVDLNETIDKAVRSVENIFSDRSIEVRLKGSGQNLKILAKPVIEEVFFNIIHNAVKMQDEKKTIVSIESGTVRGEENLVRIEISDHGPGIPDDIKKVLFERMKNKRKYVHTGIGLSLVYSLMERYGGKILVADRVEGDHSKGARFILEIPGIVEQKPGHRSKIDNE